MKSKIAKASLFSLLALGALTTISSTFNKVEDNKPQNVSYKASTDGYTKGDPIENTDIFLEEDVTYYDNISYTSGYHTIDLNGHVLAFQNAGITVTGASTVLTIKDSNPETEHKYSTSLEDHYWVLKESGDKVVKGGLIYSNNHALAAPSLLSISKGSEDIEYNSTVYINGGTICGSATKQRAVSINDSNKAGTINVIMNGGAISGNSNKGLGDDYKSSGAGVYVSGGACFTLNGGSISENVVYGCTSGGAGIYIDKSSTCPTPSKVIINGGKITKNAIYSYNSATPSQIYGGAAICAFGKLDINGGEISDNKNISYTNNDALGGAIFLRQFNSCYPVLNIKGGVIKDNSAEVVLEGATKSSFGGAIYASTGTELNLINGEISHNSADNGGGIYTSVFGRDYPVNFIVEEGGQFLISENTAKNGGGVLLSDNDYINVAGKIVIKDNETPEDNDNDNLYFYKKVAITGPLTGSNIHFNTSIDEGEFVSDYDESGHQTTFANEFFHFDGPNNKYIDVYSTGLVIKKITDPSIVTNKINLDFDDTEGIILAQYDAYIPNSSVQVNMAPIGEHHAFDKLVINYDGEDHDPYSVGDTSAFFVMPDTEVTVKATFKHVDIPEIAGKPATCTEPGYKSYYQCPDCGKCFEDSEGMILIEDLEEWKIGAGRIDPLAHSLVTIKGQAATCTTEGWKDYYQCTECHKYFEDSEGTIEITDLEVWKKGEGLIPKLKHNLKFVNGKAPTLIESGYKGYYKCKDCGSCFEDAEGLVAINDIDVWIMTEGMIAPTLGVIPFSFVMIACTAIMVTIIVLITRAIVKKVISNKEARVNSDHVFTNVSYIKKVNKKSPHLDEHVVNFTYKNHPMSYFIFLPKENKADEKTIMKKFKGLMSNGELKKYADNYYRAHYKKQLAFPVALILLVVALAGGGASVYYLMNKDITPNVEVVVPEINGVVVSNLNANIAKDYDTNISINHDLTDLVLPKTLKVFANNKALPANEYTYIVSQNNELATLHIPAEYVTGKITLELDLIDKPAIVPEDPTLSFTYKYKANENTVDFRVTSTTQNRQEVTVYWGDGADPEVKEVGSLGARFSHTYTKNKEYQIYVTGLINTISLVDQLKQYYASGNQHLVRVELYKDFIEYNNNPSYLGGYDPTFANSDPVYSDISEIYIGPNVTTIPESIFSYCNNISSLTIEEGLERVGSRSFFNSRIMGDVSFPSSVKVIDGSAFASNIGGITGEVAFNYYDYPQLEEIAGGAFSNNYITSITIPDSVTSIGENAFRDCSYLTEVNFGSDSQLTNIGFNAFAFDNRINEFRIPSSLNNGHLSDNVFTSWSSSQRIYLPLVEGYADPSGWDENWYYECSAQKIYSVTPTAWYNHDDWWNYCSNGIHGEQATTDDIGREVELKVNGINHKVRLIDVDKDQDENDQTIHTTFEFSNVICDKNGYSLAAYWYDTSNIDISNHNYLNGDGIADHNLNGGYNANWFQYYGTSHDADLNKQYSTEYHRSVLYMLPKEVRDLIKPAKKYINVYNDSWEEQYTSLGKLFLLSPKEMGFDGTGQEANTSTYAYYDSNEPDYIKKQINTEGARTGNPLQGDDLSGAYTGEKYCYAGCNKDCGSSYYLRSPYTEDNYVWNMLASNTAIVCKSSTVKACVVAMPVAPAFCI